MDFIDKLGSIKKYVTKSLAGMEENGQQEQTLDGILSANFEQGDNVRETLNNFKEAQTDQLNKHIKAAIDQVDYQIDENIADPKHYVHNPIIRKHEKLLEDGFYTDDASRRASTQSDLMLNDLTPEQLKNAGFKNPQDAVTAVDTVYQINRFENETNVYNLLDDKDLSSNIEKLSLARSKSTIESYNKVDRQMETRGIEGNEAMLEEMHEIALGKIAQLQSGELDEQAQRKVIEDLYGGVNADGDLHAGMVDFAYKMQATIQLAKDEEYIPGDVQEQIMSAMKGRTAQAMRSEVAHAMQTAHAVSLLESDINSSLKQHGGDHEVDAPFIKISNGNKTSHEM